MIKIALAQINSTVGDLSLNAKKIIGAMEEAAWQKADLVVFPELALCGYPPEDLLLKKHFINDNIKALDAIAKKAHGICAIVGFVDSDASGRIYNAAAVLSSGKIAGVYHKRELPNYGVFDEKRYFTPGVNSGIFIINKIKLGVTICEDIWVDGGIYKQQVALGAMVLINLSSSPFHAGKLKQRQDLLIKRSREFKRPLVYVNLVGGQDELVFDGGSLALNARSKVIARSAQFKEELMIVDLDKDSVETTATAMDPIEEIYHALVLGTRDYVLKNGFSKVALGLSGGIDSALVATIAVDALGKENVTGISMPSRFNSKATRADARILAKNLNIEFMEIPIDKIFKQYMRTLSLWFKSTQANSAEENLQARIRGNVLMAFSNKFNWLVLTTGNKSEMAVGYCTLYGDMSGGFAPLKDILKTKVYELCRWRNTVLSKPPIPKSIILRAPSAELRPNQRDEESLGAYEDLDAVLAAYVEEHQGVFNITNKKLPLSFVEKTAKLVDINEYKRRQSPPGIKITPRAFGKDWRLPITNHYRERS